MADPIANAIAAYASAGKIAGAPGIGARDGGGFGELVRQFASSSVGTLRQGEEASLAGIVGKADIAQVAAAVANAQTTLETVVAVRDRVIQAYQDILKMPI